MQQKNNRFLYYLPYLIVIVAVISLFTLNDGQSTKTMPYSEFKSFMKTEKVDESIVSIGYRTIEVKGTYTESGEKTAFTSTIPASEVQLEELLDDLGKAKITIVDGEASNAFMDTLYSLIPIVLIAVMGVWMMNRMAGGGGANAKAFEFGKSRAQLET